MCIYMEGQSDNEIHIWNSIATIKIVKDVYIIEKEPRFTSEVDTQ